MGAIRPLPVIVLYRGEPDQPSTELSKECLSKAQDVLPKAHDGACCAPHLSKPKALAISPWEDLPGNSVSLLEHNTSTQIASICAKLRGSKEFLKWEIQAGAGALKRSMRFCLNRTCYVGPVMHPKPSYIS